MKHKSDFYAHKICIRLPPPPTPAHSHCCRGRFLEEHLRLVSGKHDTHIWLLPSYSFHTEVCGQTRPVSAFLKQHTRTRLSSHSPPTSNIIISIARSRSPPKLLHLTGRSGPSCPKAPPSTHPAEAAGPFDAGQQRVQLRSVYARVFVCLCGMAAQRNARAHAWLSRHNGPPLSHCREIPPWWGDRGERANPGVSN